MAQDGSKMAQDGLSWRCPKKLQNAPKLKATVQLIPQKIGSAELLVFAIKQESSALPVFCGTGQENRHVCVFRE